MYTYVSLCRYFKEELFNKYRIAWEQNVENNGRHTWGREREKERESFRDRDWYKKQKIIGEEMESNDLMNDEKTIAIMNEKEKNEYNILSRI